MKLLSSECHLVLLKRNQHWFWWWFGAFMHQAITWANVDITWANICRHMTSLGRNDLRPEENGRRFVDKLNFLAILYGIFAHFTEVCSPWSTTLVYVLGQVITWTSADQHHWHKYTSLGPNTLTCNTHWVIIDLLQKTRIHFLFNTF